MTNREGSIRVVMSAGVLQRGMADDSTSQQLGRLLLSAANDQADTVQATVGMTLANAAIEDPVVIGMAGKKWSCTFRVSVWLCFALIQAKWLYKHRDSLCSTCTCGSEERSILPSFARVKSVENVENFCVAQLCNTALRAKKRRSWLRTFPNIWMTCSF